MVTIPVQWYQIALGDTASFTASGQFIDFLPGLQTNLWVGKVPIEAVVSQRYSQHLEAPPNGKLEDVVREYLGDAARRVYQRFQGTFHGVIFGLGCKNPEQVLNEMGEVVDLVNRAYTSIDLGLAYSQSKARANFRYMNVEDLPLKLPLVGEYRELLSRYERPWVI